MSGLPLVWSAPLLSSMAGYGDGARTFILGLLAAGADVRVDPVDGRPWAAQLASGAAEAIERVLTLEAPDRFVQVIHSIPDGLLSHPRAVRALGRTMYETDRLPADWVARCNGLDEVWVPSDFNVESFARAGVARDKLYKVHEPIRAELYERPGPPLRIDGAHGFVFLCVSTWSPRKGWDVLVRAFVEEFGPREDVTLVLAVPPPDAKHARAKLDEFLREQLGRDPAGRPRILLRPVALTDVDMPRLYRAADAYVMASHGEGWGRPYMEAMACGLPTIGTRWSGQLEFMDDENSYLIDCDVVDVPADAWGPSDRLSGHRWAQPSVDHLRELMRRATRERREARRRGERARTQVLDRLRSERIAQRILERLDGSAPIARAPRRGGRPSVLWEGEQFAAQGLAIGNLELCRALLGTGRVELTVDCQAPPADADPALVALMSRPPAAVPDVHVRGSSPTFERPAGGRLVLWQPWEWGAMPAEWVREINARVDELWVFSRHGREVAVRSGIAPDRVAVVPVGVNPLRFHPDVSPLWLPTRKRFRFLFVGHPLPRKGIDILLSAYLGAFSATDDVCLVVKGTRPESPNRHPAIRNALLRLQDDPAAPELLYLDAPLAADQIARLYAACQCFVAPFRGEAGPLTAAEAMACGLPAILPGYGPHLEYCDDRIALLVPAAERALDEPFAGGLETVGLPTFPEVDPEALAATMRGVYERPADARALGLRASATVRRRSAWARAADTALARIDRLCEGPSPSAAMDAAPLSVCIIARDEEASIRACVRSVRDVAGQVVVVDTGSHDRTARVAREAGAEVYSATWIGDFAAARNESLRHARHPWILVLDADETLDPGSHDELRRICRDGEPVGRLVRILNYTDAEGRANFVEHHHLRLFPNDSRLGFDTRDPHAQLRPLTPQLAFRVEPCGVALHHEGYRPQIFDARTKAQRNLEALERAVLEQPNDPFDAFNLGRTYSQLGRDPDAIAMLRRAIDLGEPGAIEPYPSYLLGAHLSLALCLFRIGRHAESATVSERALGFEPAFADAHVALAAARTALGDLDGALRAYDDALTCAGRPVLAATDRAAAGWKALLGKAEVHLVRGAPADALACAEQALALAPGEPAISAAIERVRAAA